MTWTLAPALDKLRDEVNKYAPRRSKKSDGTIGDAAHQARPTSDHNPNADGIVCAIDLTHDPRGGFHAHNFANWLRQRCARGDEWRVNYIISNGRIASKKTKFEWTEYNGENKHDKHVHVSLMQDPKKWNNRGTWWVKNWVNKPTKPTGQPTNE